MNGACSVVLAATYRDVVYLAVVLAFQRRVWNGQDGHSWHNQTLDALRRTDRLNRRSPWRAQVPNVPHRWLTEQPAVLAIELADTFVPDLNRGA